MREFMRPRGRLQKVLRLGGLALLVMPEPVTTPIGITLLGISLAVPPERQQTDWSTLRRQHPQGQSQWLYEPGDT